MRQQREIEDEHVGDEQVDALGCQCRHADDGHQQVGGDGIHAHPEHDASQANKKQDGDEVATGNRDNGTAGVEAEPGDQEATDDKSDGSAGDDDKN